MAVLNYFSVLNDNRCSSEDADVTVPINIYFALSNREIGKL